MIGKIPDDNFFMKEALKEAQKAFDAGEVPVGAVLTSRNQIIIRSHNQTELLKDVTAHAEILAITGASGNLGTKYLSDCALYVTLEPCAMCAGALGWAQLGKLVYAASDDKKGFNTICPDVLHPKTLVSEGLMAEESSELLRSFFKLKRKAKI